MINKNLITYHVPTSQIFTVPPMRTLDNDKTIARSLPFIHTREQNKRFSNVPAWRWRRRRACRTPAAFRAWTSRSRSTSSAAAAAENPPARGPTSGPSACTAAGAGSPWICRLLLSPRCLWDTGSWCWWSLEFPVRRLKKLRCGRPEQSLRLNRPKQFHL